MTSYAPTLPATGIHLGVPAEEYHAWPAAGSSVLREILRASPLHAAYMVAAARETPAMRIGTAVHCAVLEPDEWESRYAVAPHVDRRTTAGKQEWERHLAAAGDRVTLAADDAETVRRCADAVMRCDAARRVLKLAPEREASVLSRVLGIPVKARVDACDRDLGRIVELKTTSRGAGREEFERSIERLGYGLQAAHYKSVARAATGDDDAGTDVIYIVVETEPPHGVAVYRLRDQVIGLYHELHLALLARWNIAMAESRWEGYPDEVQDIGIPAWAAKGLQEMEIGGDHATD